jgi:hypothetical protein
MGARHARGLLPVTAFATGQNTRAQQHENGDTDHGTLLPVLPGMAIVTVFLIGSIEATSLEIGSA